VVGGGVEECGLEGCSGACFESDGAVSRDGGGFGLRRSGWGKEGFEKEDTCIFVGSNSLRVASQSFCARCLHARSAL
jgi:hypothetical protein